MHTPGEKRRSKIMLVGPGRWGTSMPQLGVPVSFREINSASVICEIDTMHEGLVPDLSMGTHFFNDMVEFDILYMAYFAQREGNRFLKELFLQAPNHLSDLNQIDAQWESVIRVVNTREMAGGDKVYLSANPEKQIAILFFGED